MREDSLIVRCPHCGTKNRIPRDRWGGRATCGKCGSLFQLKDLYPDGPVEVVDANFQQEVAGFPGQVLVEFSAPW
jgi:thioredoxin 2